MSLDYPVGLTIRSMLPVCDEVVVCDSDSSDGTRPFLNRLAIIEPKIRIINRPWPDPKGNSAWYTDWLNFAREHLRFEMMLQLDADEVLDDTTLCHNAIRNAVHDGHALTVDRLNFWRDGRSLIPDGHCCGKWVTRLGPSKYWLPSDEPHHPGECEILDVAQRQQDVKIFHLGFLREQDAFYAKAKVVLGAFFNRYDTRLEDAERAGKPLWESSCDFADKLEPYTGSFPRDVEGWLFRHGFRV